MSNSFPTQPSPLCRRRFQQGSTSARVDANATGRLTIHGVTKDVTLKAKAQLVGDKVEIAGSALIDMNDYGVPPPQVPFVTVESATTLEFDIFLDEKLVRGLGAR